MIHLPTAPWAHSLFDLAAWGGGMALGWGLYRWRLGEAVDKVAMKVDGWYFAALVAGAVPGAWLAGSFNTLRAGGALSHSVVGALVGAIAAVEIYKAIRGVQGSTGAIFVGSFTLGVVIGRFGCLFSGLADQTYGSPTTVPFAVDLGDGIGRHPVQIYESAVMALFLLTYLAGLAARAPWAMRRGFYAMCLVYGIQRFAWEFLKPYPRLIGPLNIFHVLCLGLVVYGLGYYLGDLRRERRAQVGPLSVPGPDHQPV